MTKFSMHFNPRSREGSDRTYAKAGISTYNISIHAPARGATKPVIDVEDVRIDFNPRSREGSDNYLM